MIQENELNIAYCVILLLILIYVFLHLSLLNMSTGRNKKKKLSDEEICDTISQAITDIINMSRNSEFKKECNEILQVESTSALITDKLNAYFSRFMKKKCRLIHDFFETYEIEEKEETFSVDALIKNMDDAHINAVKELDGFDKWEEFSREEQ